MGGDVLQRLLLPVCDAQGVPVGGAGGAIGGSGGLHCLCGATGTRQQTGEYRVASRWPLSKYACTLHDKDPCLVSKPAVLC